jgi:hypothetical protein
MGVWASAVVAVLVMEEVVSGSEDQGVTAKLSVVVDCSMVESVVVSEPEVGKVGTSQSVSDAEVAKDKVSEEDASKADVEVGSDVAVEVSS